MEGDSFLALMRLTLSDDQIVANLARMALKLAKGIREAEARAELAEAALQAERARTDSFAAALQRTTSPMPQPIGPDASRRVKITRETSVVLEIQ